MATLVDPDRYYTPPLLAERLASMVTAEKVGACLDSTCGDGNLLAAVAARFPHATCVGIDIDAAAVARVRRRHPAWHIFHGDSLDPHTRKNARTRARVAIDVVVGNPPFSMGPLRGVENPVLGTRSSIAMAHLTRDLIGECPRLGGAFILPESCLTAELDHEARKALAHRFDLTVLGRLETTAFSGTRARAVIVRAAPVSGSVGMAPSGVTAPEAKMVSNEIVRGGLPRHEARAARRGVRYCHSTDLRHLVRSGGRTVASLPLVHGIGRGVIGPGRFLLLPRVGRPHPEQFRAFRLEGRVQLSDCVIGIHCANEHAERLFRKGFDALLSMYSGTAAPYVTVKQVVEWVTNCLADSGPPESLSHDPISDRR